MTKKKKIERMRSMFLGKMPIFLKIRNLDRLSCSVPPEQSEIKKKEKRN
jgi:hypothetical protein